MLLLQWDWKSDPERYISPPCSTFLYSRARETRSRTMYDIPEPGTCATFQQQSGRLSAPPRSLTWHTNSRAGAVQTGCFVELLYCHLPTLWIVIPLVCVTQYLPCDQKPHDLLWKRKITLFLKQLCKRSYQNQSTSQQCQNNIVHVKCSTWRTNLCFSGTFQLRQTPFPGCATTSP